LAYRNDAKKRRTIRITTEKAVSEAIISTVLAEVQDRNVTKTTLFSGETLLGDKSAGLNGEVDFIFVGQADAPEIMFPVISITEAKLNQSIEKSKSQAIAQMKGAQVFNKKNNEKYETVFGVVTNGTQWIFMKLKGDTITFDDNEYLINDLPSILGVFQQIIDSF
jgi:co-chaperonin GroES (HSP10)